MIMLYVLILVWTAPYEEGGSMTSVPMATEASCEAAGQKAEKDLHHVRHSCVAVR